MTWAFRRQILYVGALFITILVFGFLIFRPNFNKAPSCTDHKQNGTETGVDCGGSCTLACVEQVDPVSILWSRSFRVVPGRYNAVAYLENHNKNAAVNRISYRFRFADANNLYIGKREGSTFIPPSGKFAIFEPAIDVGNSIPVYTTFEFTQPSLWVQIPEEKINQLKLAVSNIKLSDEDTSPLLSAEIKNNSFSEIPDLGIIAILYDANNNAVSASRTLLDSLSAGEKTEINFTWPEPFESPVVAKEIIPMTNYSLVK